MQLPLLLILLLSLSECTFGLSQNYIGEWTALHRQPAGVEATFLQEEQYSDRIAFAGRKKNLVTSDIQLITLSQ